MLLVNCVLSAPLYDPLQARTTENPQLLYASTSVRVHRTKPSTVWHQTLLEHDCVQTVGGYCTLGSNFCGCGRKYPTCPKIPLVFVGCLNDNCTGRCLVFLLKSCLVFPNFTALSHTHSHLTPTVLVQSLSWKEFLFHREARLPE